MTLGLNSELCGKGKADRVRKVKKSWAGPHIRSAAGQLMTPAGKCTARLQTGDLSFLATSALLPDCRREQILGIDFLQDHGAIINIPE